MHSPEHAEEAAEARRHGGLRKRRERTLQVVYDVEGMETVPQLRRVLQIAVLEALGLERGGPAQAGGPGPAGRLPGELPRAT